MTLQEVLQLDNRPLINPDTLIYDKEHLEKGLINHFLFREIAFSAPDKFRWKLNAYISERANSYNKMFTSQLIEIDPFVTDYIVESNSSNQNYRETKSDKQAQFNKRNSTYVSDLSSDSKENYTDSDEIKHYKENTGVELKARLNSESENKNNKSERDISLTHKEKTTENTTTDKTVDETITENNNKDYTHSQTARNWTENGNSSGHNLDVHSDTPQAMLFNTPPHYTGTGRMSNEGKNLGTSTEEHYAETDPASFDSASYTWNSGDSPWFNYASNADNKIGHDSYSKQGTETYAQSDNTKETNNKNGNTESNEEIDTNGTRDFTETTSENINGVDSRSLNTNEHTKGDTKQQENYKEQSGTTADTINSNITKRADNTNTTNDISSNRKQNNKHDTKTEGSSVRKGRIMRSPSKLLDEYRETMTFNADLWLFGELEPLFMQLF